MKRAFEKAFKQANPDYVVFLGDLVDEGVEMQFYPEQFKWTLDRFYSIFPIGNKTNVRNSLFLKMPVI
jgi:predicted phosphodiesterase